MSVSSPRLPIALLPLDSRPCNVRFPRQLAALGGERLMTPETAILGDLRQKAEQKQVRHWMANLPEVSALIVSLDLLAYGGLVPSRHPHISAEEALTNLEALREFRAARPQTPIYAFNILMRLGTTLDSEKAATDYFNIMRYARLIDEAEQFDSAYLREQLSELERAIPPATLQKYLDARARNLKVHQTMVSWLAESTFDFLLIAQEDAAEFGLHRHEQQQLLTQCKTLGVEEKFSLHPGADEAALTLLARHWDTATQFRIHWTSPENARRIAPFEDRPFEETLQLHIRAMKGAFTTENSADFELFVNAPVGGWSKEEKAEDRKQRAVSVETFVSAIEDAIKAGKRVAVCDVAFPNGADDLLMNTLDRQGLLGKLDAYGGWNTAGNTTGALLAQCAASLRNPVQGQALNQQFLFERLVDDWFYQTRVRSQVEKSARSRGVSPLDFGVETEFLAERARRELCSYAHLIAQRHFSGLVQRCEVSFPWRRSFEIDFRAQFAPSDGEYLSRKEREEAQAQMKRFSSVVSHL